MNNVKPGDRAIIIFGKHIGKIVFVSEPSKGNDLPPLTNFEQFGFQWVHKESKFCWMVESLGSMFKGYDIAGNFTGNKPVFPIEDKKLKRIDNLPPEQEDENETSELNLEKSF